MVALICDRESLINAVDSIDSTNIISKYILLYLNSYGTGYDFLQSYVQIDLNRNVTAVILRYNTQVYVLADSKSASEELSSFLYGFSGCEIFINNDIISSASDKQRCYIMSRKGSFYNNASDNIKPTDSVKSATMLLSKDFSEERKTDFFLNTSHQL